MAASFVIRKSLCLPRYFLGKYTSRSESAYVVFSLENESTMLGIVEFQGKARQCRRDSGAKYAAGRARISFLLRNNCERNVVVAAAKHATSTLTLSKFQLSRLPLLSHIHPSLTHILPVSLHYLLMLCCETAQ